MASPRAAGGPKDVLSPIGALAWGRTAATALFIVLAGVGRSNGIPAATPAGKASATPAASTPSTTITVPLASATICVQSLSPVSIDGILSEYEAGDWKKLGRRLAGIRTGLMKACDRLKDYPAAGRMSFAIVNDHSPQPTVIRILAGGNPEPSLFSQRITSTPLITVYLHRDATTPIWSTYTGSPVASPVESGATLALSTVAGGLAKGSPFSNTDPADVLQQKVLEDNALDVRSESSGKKIKAVRDLLAIPSQAYLIRRGLGEMNLVESEKVKALIVSSQVQCEVVATVISDDLRWAQVTATDNVNVQAELTAQSLLRRIDDRLRDSAGALDSNDLVHLLNVRLEAEFQSANPCAPQSDTNTAPISVMECQRCMLRDFGVAIADAGVDYRARDAALSVYELYLGLLSATPSVSVQTAYSFGPLTHWTFGLGAGALLRVNLNRKGKLDTNNVVVDDTPTALVTTVNVYYDPWGFDETTPSPSLREWPRAIGGIVLTPSPGLFLGVGTEVPILRSVFINGGYAVMLTPVLVNGLRPGQSVDPSAGVTRRGPLGAWFAQIGYGF